MDVLDSHRSELGTFRANNDSWSIEAGSPDLALVFVSQDRPDPQ
jgi:hypothetical protein